MQKAETKQVKYNTELLSIFECTQQSRQPSKFARQCHIVLSTVAVVAQTYY